MTLDNTEYHFNVREKDNKVRIVVGTSHATSTPTSNEWYILIEDCDDNLLWKHRNGSVYPHKLPSYELAVEIAEKFYAREALS